MAATRREAQRRISTFPLFAAAVEALVTKAYSSLPQILAKLREALGYAE